MSLFGDTAAARQALPYDGAAIYYGPVLSPDLAKRYFERMLNRIAWRHDETFIFGKRIVTARKVAWYGDRPYTYTYSKVSKKALPFTAELRAIKQEIEHKTASRYNSCLLNLYHNGSEGVGWHSDNERSLGRCPTIAVLSLGAERRFSFRHKIDKTPVSLSLETGSLLLMKGDTQRCWLHRLPPSKKVIYPRISLTFRAIVGQG